MASRHVVRFVTETRTFMEVVQSYDGVSPSKPFNGRDRVVIKRYETGAPNLVVTEQPRFTTASEELLLGGNALAVAHGEDD